MLSSLEQKVCANIATRYEALLEDLRRHVGLPTGPGDANALDDSRGLLTARLVALGARLTLIPGDPAPDWLTSTAAAGPAATARIPPPTGLCSRVTSRPGRTRVLLSGHLDTVHAVTSSFRALTVASDGRTATGPGCVDMKGGLVIAVQALEALEECGADCAWSFILNSDEETGSYHSDGALRAAAKDHDFGIALEPAMEDGGLVVERPGSGQFMLEVRGRSAHVGRDFKRGVSAVTALAERLVAVGRMADPDRGLIVNVGPLQGGVAANVVPDLARAWGNVRFPNDSVAAEIETRLRSLTSRGVPEDSIARGEAHASLSTSFNRPPKPATEGTLALAAIARTAAEDLGQKLPFGKTGGVCDGNNLQAAGLPTIDTLGVRGGGLHTPTEWIELASLVERCQLLAIVMLRLGAIDPGPRRRAAG